MSFDSEPSQRVAFLKNEVDGELDSSSLTHRRWSEVKRCILLRTSSWPWILSTMLFACTTALLLFQTWTATGSHADRLPCDDDPGGLPVALGVGNKRVEVTFTGGLTYNSSGALVAEYEPGQRRWAGEPSPNMDEAWDDLEEYWVVLLDGEEADNVRGQTLLQDGYWVTGLDVMHQLHCLDSLRRLAYPDYYPREGTPRNWELHINHCIDYLRQAITCHGDTNPIHYKWHAGIRAWGPDFATSRYCPRIMDDLVAWSHARTPKARAGTKGKETTVINGVVVDDMEEEGDKLDLEGGRKHHHGREHEKTGNMRKRGT